MIVLIGNRLERGRIPLYVGHDNVQMADKLVPLEQNGPVITRLFAFAHFLVRKRRSAGPGITRVVVAHHLILARESHAGTFRVITNTQTHFKAKSARLHRSPLHHPVGRITPSSAPTHAQPSAARSLLP